MPSRKLVVEFVGDTKSLERALGRSRSDVDQFGGATARSTKKMDGFRKAAGLAFVGGLGAATFAIKGSIKAAGDAQVSQSKMQTQLKALGISYQAHAKQIDKVIQKTSQLSGLDDEDLQDAFTNIIRITGDVNKSLRLTGLAADFARAKHMDVAKAGELVAKVAGGNTAILSRYGITIDKGASATEALGILQKKFSGQAEAYGKTAAGAQDRFKVATENLQEALGQGLLPAVTKVANAVAGSVAYFEKHSTQAKILLGAVGTLTVGLGVFSIATKVAAATTAAWSAAQTILNVVLAANPIGIVIVGLVALGAALVVAWKKSETFRTVVLGVWNAIKSATTTAWNAIKGTLVAVWSALKGLVTGYFNAYRTVITGVWNAVKASTIAVWSAIKTVATGAWGALRDAAGATWGAIRGAILTPIRGARDVLADVWRSIKDSAAAAWGRMKDGASSFASGLKDSIVGAFKGAANAVIGFVNKIIDVINVIPGVPNIKHIKALAQGGVHSASENTQGFARGGAFAKTGGIVNRPMTFMGEEAPRHPEFVIPTNPAYRKRAMGLLGDAASALGLAHGGIYSQLEMAGLWQNAHGPKNQSLVASAVGMAESHGDSQARNPSGASGLWQILGLPFAGNPFNAATNARMAVSKWANAPFGGHNWSPWEAYTNGAYKQYMNPNAAGPAIGLGDIIGKLPGVGGLPDWLQGTGKYVLSKVKDWIGDKVKSLLGPTVPSGGIPKGMTGSVQDAITLAMSMGFGYPSANQISGGQHASGSLHYAGRAVDFGDAGHTSNEMQGLWAALLRMFGSHINELFYDPMPFFIDNFAKHAGAFGGHGDHIHIGFQKGGVFGGMPFLGSYHTGGVAPREGLAHVQRGEVMTPAGMAPEIHVYIGDRELTDMVDVRIVERDRQIARTYRAGVLR